MAVLLSTLHELSLQFLQRIQLLFPHRLAERIRLAPGEIRKFPGQEHHLLLIDGNAIRLAQDILHARKVVLNFLLSLLACDKIRNIVHRPRPVQRIHSDQVLETLRMEALQPRAHAVGFKLEEANGIAPAIDFIGFLVVNGNGFDVDVRTVQFLDVVQAGVNDGQGVEPEKVHFEHARFLDIVTVVL